VFISCFEVFIYLALMQSGGSSRVQTGRIGYGFKHAGPNQFDLLEEIGRAGSIYMLTFSNLRLILIGLQVI
jgi:hypothetical protein